LLYVFQPIQTVIYDLVYLWVGPSEATETAILTHFVTVGILGFSVAMLLGDYLSDRLAHREQILKATGGLVGLIVVFLGIALSGYAAFLTALLVLVVGFLGVPLLLRYRYDVRSGSVPAFLGGIPVLVLFLLLVGFGLGWG
jgi:predicted MFS family arabinose efflux permease